MHTFILICLYATIGLLISELEIQNLDKLLEMSDYISEDNTVYDFIDKTDYKTVFSKLAICYNLFFWPLEVITVLITFILYNIKKRKNK